MGKKRKPSSAAVKVVGSAVETPRKKPAAELIPSDSEASDQGMENDEAEDSEGYQEEEEKFEHATISMGSRGQHRSGSDQDSEDEPVHKLLEPFSKEQLILLVREAISMYPSFIDSVRKIADSDPTHRKIFVYGLGWDTTAETLLSAFNDYGEIEDCKSVIDKITGKSKGYAFILFKHRMGARRALKLPQKKIGNRIASCQLASTGPLPTAATQQAMPLPVSEYTQRKIFVSNVSSEIDPYRLYEFFSRYGDIEEGPLGLDKSTGKPKGFALFVYRSLESARRALEDPHKNFEGHLLHCQKAVDGPKVGRPFYNQTQYFQPQNSAVPARKEKGPFAASASGSGHLVAPSGPPLGFNVAAAPVAAQGLNPALGQALTAFLASQGAGFGLSNFLGGLGGAANQSVPSLVGHALHGGYVSQSPLVYGAQPGIQAVYPNPQIGHLNVGRPPQGGASYLGH